jgi:hypothetical protein
VTVSTELINDPTPVVGSTSRITESVPSVQTPSTSQCNLQHPQSILEDIFTNIQNVQVDFVYRLIQNGTLNFIQQTYKTDPIDDTRLQNSMYITKRGVLQGIHQVSHPNSHSYQVISSKSASKRTPNFCCQHLKRSREQYLGSLKEPLNKTIEDRRILYYISGGKST